MNIYDIIQIDQRISELLADENCTDPETGELLPDIDASLDALQMERTEKIDNLACYIKNLDHIANDMRDEERKTAARRQAVEAKAERLKGYLSSALAGEKFSSPRVAISFRRTSSVRVDEAVFLASKANSHLPGAITYEPKISKTAIKRAIELGIEVDGAEIVSSMSMSIK